DCFAFVDVEPAECAAACVRTYNKCKWKKSVLKVERVRRGPFSLDLLKTPKGWEGPKHLVFQRKVEERQRQQLEDEGQASPTPAHVKLCIRKRRGRRGTVSIKAKKPKLFDEEEDGEDSDSSLVVDYGEIQAPQSSKSDEASLLALKADVSRKKAKIDEAAQKVRERESKRTAAALEEIEQTPEFLENEGKNAMGLLSQILEVPTGAPSKEELAEIAKLEAS
ncbi:Uncharacterized protein SCF082_LOCUS34825, partial [Durusdinium trenchii]